MMALDPRCSVPNKCWEHYQGAYARVREKDIELAMALVRLRAATCPPTLMGLRDVSHAINYAQTLINRQWCQMVRAPFTFPVAAERERPASHSALSRTQPSLDSL